MRPRIAYSDHLVSLIAQAEGAAARVAGAEPQQRARLATSARRESARLSVRLDASPLEDATADAVDARERAGQPVAPDPGPPPRPMAAPAVASPPSGGGWALALKLEGMPTQEMAAIEYANLLACYDLEVELADCFFERPLAALRTLHGRVCAGLVDPEAVGRWRRTAQAVHDGAQGRVIYNAADPRALPGLLAGLADWLGRGSARLPALVVGGVVHERLLQWQPFEAGNGRVARCASRVVLRARGVDPDGVAVVERGLAADALGYYGEVAATMRRRDDLAPWLERYAEAAVDALEDAAEALAPRPTPSLPARARWVVEDMAPGEPLTVAEYAERAGVSLEGARMDLRALTTAKVLRPQPRTQGLRYRRVQWGAGVPGR